MTRQHEDILVGSTSADFRGNGNAVVILDASQKVYVQVEEDAVERLPSGWPLFLVHTMVTTQETCVAFPQVYYALRSLHIHLT